MSGSNLSDLEDPREIIQKKMRKNLYGRILHAMFEYAFSENTRLFEELASVHPLLPELMQFKNADGLTPMALAFKIGNLEAIKNFRKWGGDFSFASYKHGNLFCLAFQHIQVLYFLLENAPSICDFSDDFFERFQRLPREDIEKNFQPLTAFFEFSYSRIFVTKRGQLLIDEIDKRRKNIIETALRFFLWGEIEDLLQASPEYEKILQGFLELVQETWLLDLASRSELTGSLLVDAIANSRFHLFYFLLKNKIDFETFGEAMALAKEKDLFELMGSTHPAAFELCMKYLKEGRSESCSPISPLRLYRSCSPCFDAATAAAGGLPRVPTPTIFVRT